ncbi:hypothetical protein MPTK1_1g09495 [Marchantia polymorpha subsp. ruderalis]|uniref:Uncharacterized protein n=1 Tax=Marchantia polymorpha subsp. ruderalis TaxID=1480154 RepID=A0A176WNT3_MARPO|nr:hypothetical protein AXG93_4145s1060 [Marchantia polymorpha subsp. ruderalis]
MDKRTWPIWQDSSKCERAQKPIARSSGGAGLSPLVGNQGDMATGSRAEIPSSGFCSSVATLGCRMPPADLGSDHVDWTLCEGKEIQPSDQRGVHLVLQHTEDPVQDGTKFWKFGKGSG